MAFRYGMTYSLMRWFPGNVIASTMNPVPAECLQRGGCHRAMLFNILFPGLRFAHPGLSDSCRPCRACFSGKSELVRTLSFSSMNSWVLQIENLSTAGNFKLKENLILWHKPSKRLLNYLTGKRSPCWSGNGDVSSKKRFFDGLCHNYAQKHLISKYRM